MRAAGRILRLTSSPPGRASSTYERVRLRAATRRLLVMHQNSLQPQVGSAIHSDHAGTGEGSGASAFGDCLLPGRTTPIRSHGPFGGLSGRRIYPIVCAVSSDEGRRRGRAASREAGRVRNTATLVVDGRMEKIDEIWMTCEVRRPQRVLPYAGGHGPSRAPKIAISCIRPSDTHERPYCFFALSPFLGVPSRPFTRRAIFDPGRQSSHAATRPAIERTSLCAR
jgi:hypothetical protein